MCSLIAELQLYNVISTHSIECVLLLQNVFSYCRTIDYVLLLFIWQKRPLFKSLHRRSKRQLSQASQEQKAKETYSSGKKTPLFKSLDRRRKRQLSQASKEKKATAPFTIIQREHILQQENTFYSKRTHSIATAPFTIIQMDGHTSCYYKCVAHSYREPPLPAVMPANAALLHGHCP